MDDGELEFHTGDQEDIEELIRGGDVKWVSSKSLEKLLRALTKQTHTVNLTDEQANKLLEKFAAGFDGEYNFEFLAQHPGIGNNAMGFYLSKMLGQGGSDGPSLV